MQAVAPPPSRPTPGGKVFLVSLESLALRREASALYRAAFDYNDVDSALSPRMLRGLLANGGTAVGAVDDTGRLLGFSYGFTGTDGDIVYHYSQATAVAPDAQGRGLGRLLKQAQADAAREHGATSMRWAFDPCNTRNGHFNLDVLGARGRWFSSDFYDEPDTDRMIAEWSLVREPRRSWSASAERDRVATEIAAAAHDGPPAAAGETGDQRWIRLPAELPADPAAARAIRELVAAASIDALADGTVALSCRRVPGTGVAVYLFGSDEA
jgi:predicted GNAT superfamily acetyltransferase